MFPIKFWNVYERVMENNPRTSNFVEGFHSKLNKCIKTYHPSMWKFLTVIRRIQQQTENSLTKLQAPDGLPRLQSNKCRVVNEHLTNILKSYRKTFKFNAFKTWIFKLINFVPAYKN